MALVIVNADDYGLTEATSHEILRCHREGIVTSTTVLALAPGFAGTARLLAEHPTLGVGVHLALVGEDPPLVPASRIPTLVNRDGMLPTSWREFVRKAALGRIDPADVEREWRAQIDRVRAAGVPLTHLDSHQHLHQWPSLWPVLHDLTNRTGIRVIRTTSHASRGVMGMLGHLSRRRALHAGIRTTDSFLGFRQSGSLDESALVQVLQAILPSGSTEIGCHPGPTEDAERHRYRWGFQWSAESAALRSDRVRQLVRERGHRLGTFADLG